MDKRKGIILALLILLAVSVGSVLVINNTNVLSEWDVKTVNVVKQYIKVLGFMCIMGLVYLRLKSKPGTSSNEIEE